MLVYGNAGTGSVSVWSKRGTEHFEIDFFGRHCKGDNRTGFFIGPMAEFTIPIVGLGVDVAALYNQSGAKAQSGNEEVSQTFKSIEVILT